VRAWSENLSALFARLGITAHDATAISKTGQLALIAGDYSDFMPAAVGRRAVGGSLIAAAGLNLSTIELQARADCVVERIAGNNPGTLFAQVKYDIGIAPAALSFGLPAAVALNTGIEEVASTVGAGAQLNTVATQYGAANAVPFNADQAAAFLPIFVPAGSVFALQNASVSADDTLEICWRELPHRIQNENE